MAFVSDEQVVKALRQYNPWWRTPAAVREACKPVKRLAFYEALRMARHRTVRRFVVLSGARRVGKTTIMRQMMARLIDEGVPPKNILYVSFDNPMLKLVVIAENDIFGGRIKKKKKRKSSTYSGSRITSLDDLHPGDYVVHETYGLGVYKSIEKIASGDSVKDYIKLEYAGGGVLYVLATELDMVQKYASADID